MRYRLGNRLARAATAAAEGFEFLADFNRLDPRRRCRFGNIAVHDVRLAHAAFRVLVLLAVVLAVAPVAASTAPTAPPPAAPVTAFAGLLLALLARISGLSLIHI